MAVDSTVDFPRTPQAAPTTADGWSHPSTGFPRAPTRTAPERGSRQSTETRGSRRRPRTQPRCSMPCAIRGAGPPGQNRGTNSGKRHRARPGQNRPCASASRRVGMATQRAAPRAPPPQRHPPGVRRRTGPQRHRCPPPSNRPPSTTHRNAAPPKAPCGRLPPLPTSDRLRLKTMQSDDGPPPRHAPTLAPPNGHLRTKTKGVAQSPPPTRGRASPPDSTRTASAAHAHQPEDQNPSSKCGRCPVRSTHKHAVRLRPIPLRHRRREAYLRAPCGRGGIGRHARFRIWCRKAWGFESLRPHTAPLTRATTWKSHRKRSTTSMGS